MNTLKSEGPWGDKRPQWQQGNDFLLNLMRRYFKGKPPQQSPLLIILVIVVIGLAWLATGLYTLQPGEQAIVLRFGKWDRTEEVAGLHYRLPAPIERIYKKRTDKVNELAIGGQGSRTVFGGENTYTILTGDESISLIEFVVFWKIKDLKDYMLNARDPRLILKEASESAMREIIGQTDIAPIVSGSGWNTINFKVLQLLQRMVDQYQLGIEIRNVELQKGAPPAEVVDAFADVQRAKEDRQRLINEAKAIENDIIPKARGRSKEMLAQAEAYNKKRVLEAEGHSKRFMKLLTETKKSSAVEKITKERLYYETLEELLKDKNKIIMDANVSKSGMVPLLPVDKLMPTKKNGR